MSLVRYSENPFLDDLQITVAKKSVRVSAMGQDDNVLVNQKTGEINGTHVSTYKKVDSEEFIKLFTRNIAMAFDLKAAGMKALTCLMWIVQHKAMQKDIVPLDKVTLNEFLVEHDLKLSLATFKRGISELENSKVIAKSMRAGFYFINPSFIFNGNRIAFTTIIEKKKNGNQMELIK